MKDRQVLNSLLEKAGRYHPLYGGGLATHLPMVLIALSQLGASNDKLQRTFQTSITNLEPIGDFASVVAVEQVESQLGQAESYQSYLTYYQTELAKHGVKTTLANALPILMPGVAASAFHGLIRLAYAIEANNLNEIAVALAYWSAEYQPFELSQHTTNEALEQIIARLSPLGESHNFSPGIIVDRMDEIGELLKCKGAVFQPESIDLATLKQFTLQLFYLCDDFTLLHTVTGCHALSIILPFLNDQESALRAFWQAVLVAYLSTAIGYPNTVIEVKKCECNFDLVIKKALLSDDSHVIKLVYSCLSEYRENSNPLYYLVAQRAILSE